MDARPGETTAGAADADAADAATRAAEFERALRAEPPPPAAEPTGSRLDDAWQRWMSAPAARRAWEWGAPAAVVVLAAVTRLAGLGHPRSLVFDERYYVKDAYTLSQLGYEARWPADANEAFAAGDVGIHLTDASFIVHPPLGKWIIAAGMAVFGADDPVGWRVGMAVVGVLLVVVTMLVAKRLFASTTLAVLAGGLLAIDGNAIVMSRVALLDNGVALFVLVGAWFVLLDRGWAARRTDAWIERREAAGRPIDWGPVLLWRPWLLAAAVAFGCATAVKWNGVYALAVFGVYTVVSDALLRRRAGVAFWGTGTVLRQGPVSALLLVPLALVVHLASWAGWFASDGGYFRHWVEQGGERWTGALSGVPIALQNWWHYQAEMMNYHVNLTTEHGYQANPLTWLFLVRPTSMYYNNPGDGTAEAILGIANPLLWWGGTAALVFLLVRVIHRLATRHPVAASDAFILTGMAACYLPWLLYLHRTVFQFYTIAFEPFLVLALVAALAAVAGDRSDPRPRRTAGLTTVGVYLGLVVLVSAFFLPMWTGMSAPWWFLRSHYWLPTWI